MKDRKYWKLHYVVQGDAEEIERHTTTRSFLSGTDHLDLLCFERNRDAPAIVISPGSGGHSYVFAELGYEIFRRGHNVFVMPKHGGRTVRELYDRLPPIKKKLIEVNGSVYWMLSHSREAASAVCGWFDETL